MKRIVLTRHGKAELHQYGISDFDRQLMKRGQKEAPMIAEKIKEKGIVPEVFISSPAKRAFQTAEKFADVFGYPKDSIITRDFIYGHFNQDKLIYLIEETASFAETVIVFGHNPTFEELAYYLSERFNEFIPTSGCVVIEFDVNQWSEIEARKGKVKYFEYPKKYGA